MRVPVKCANLSTLVNIRGFSQYAVDENGVVYSYFSDKYLVGRVDAKGYLSVTIKSDKGKLVTKRIHRLIAETLIPNPHNLPCVRHKDGVPHNNKKSNLCWGTYKDNELDKIEHGTYDLRRSGKLSENDRVKALKLFEDGMEQKDIAKLFGVTRPTINRLINGRTWSGFKCAA